MKRKRTFTKSYIFINLIYICIYIFIYIYIYIDINMKEQHCDVNKGLIFYGNNLTLSVISTKYITSMYITNCAYSKNNSISLILFPVTSTTSQVNSCLSILHSFFDKSFVLFLYFLLVVLGSILFFPV